MGVIFTPDQAPRISLSAPAVPVPPFSRLRRVLRPAPMPRTLRGGAMAKPALGHSTARVWSSASRLLLPTKCDRHVTQARRRTWTCHFVSIHLQCAGQPSHSPCVVESKHVTTYG